MKLRLKWSHGQAKLELPNEATLADLQGLVATETGCQPDGQRLFGGFPPKPVEGSNDTVLKSIGICSGDQVTLEQKKITPPTPPLASFAFAVGDQVAYRPTGEPCQITAVHPDPDEEFYSIRFAQGNERQTTRQKLDLPDAAVAPAEWSCSLCTLKNPGNVTVCGACETPKPNTAGAAAGPTGSVAAPVSSGATAASLARMPDDNSCLFHSIAYLLGGPGEDATALRRVIAGAVKRDPSRWNFGTLGKEPSEYVTFITNPIRWGGQVELCILSEHYRCEISVTDIQTGRVDIYGEGLFPRRVYLAFSGIHFDAIELQTPAGLTKEVASRDACADAAVKTLVATRRSEGQFTDQLSMRLRCKTCGAIVSGDYEARLHSGTFNHTEFVPA